MLLPHFMGQVGMRIMQRPQGASVFKDEDGNFDKDAMDEFMDRTYIENIWYFSKDKNKDIPFDKIIYMMQNIYDEAENTDNLEKLIELYENAYQLNSMASQKAKESNIKIIKIN